MEKIIIFDWGGVILKEYPNHYCDRDAIVETIKKFNSNYSFNEAYQLYLDTLHDENGNNISIYDDYENKYKWFKRINDKGNLNTTYDVFVSEFINNYKKIDKFEEIIDYIYSLKGKCKLYLFSDLIFTCFDCLCDQINLDVFDDVFLSYKEGFCKSNIDAFKNVTSKIGCRVSNILFIDNNNHNIVNANSVGWNTLCARGEDIDLIKEEVDSFLKE
jgi:FMN phosphatase YigB (HAD superfamily)